jgi:hypothetical protein
MDAQRQISEQLHNSAPAKISVPDVLKNFAQFFGVRTEEEPRYTVQEKDGDKEIRNYHPMTLAHVSINGDYESSMELGFYQLAEYIFGKNTWQTRMEMTVPVLQQRTSSGWMVSVILPSKFDIATAPPPLNARIELSQKPAETVAVHKYSGWTNKKIIYSKTKELSQWLNENNRYKVLSKPRSAVYDPSFALPFLRRNEIHISVTSTEIH